MGKKEHRLGVSEINLVVRHLKLAPVDQNNLQAMVLDEADEMLKMGFIEDIDFILSCLVHEHRTLLFSATMPREIDRLTKTYLSDPIRLELVLVLHSERPVEVA